MIATIKQIWAIVTHMKCPACNSFSVTHSHTEPIGTTTIEVYECAECKKKFT